MTETVRTVVEPLPMPATVVPGGPGKPAVAQDEGKKVPRPTTEDWPTRRRLAYALIALLGLIVLAGLVAMFATTDLQRVKDVLTLTIGPVSGLVGAVVGFYFGSKSTSGTTRQGGAGGQKP